MHLDHLNDEVYFHIGECFAREHKWKSAINAYQKALSIEDKREEYFAAIAEAYYQVEDFEKLLSSIFEKAINIVPEELQYWLQYASFPARNRQSRKKHSRVSRKCRTIPQRRRR